MEKRYATASCAIFLICATYGEGFNLLRVNKSFGNEKPCNLPADSGMCFASIQRYFYNSSSNRCETFIYGGCLGNGNNFRTEQQCTLTCKDVTGNHIPEADSRRGPHNSLLRFELTGLALKDDCDLPKDPGHCYASFRRFYFNGDKCESFIFGGCGGNRNNFKTKEQCTEKCGQSPEIGSGATDDDLFLPFIEF